MTIQPMTTAGTSTIPSAHDRKLADGAHEFEAMLLNEMLKPLKFGQAESSDTDEDGGAGDTVRSLGTEAMSKAISMGGGLGIAREIVSQVVAQRAQHGSTLATSKV